MSPPDSTKDKSQSYVSEIRVSWRYVTLGDEIQDEVVITKQQNPANTRSTKDKQKQKHTKRNDSTANCDDRDDHHHPDNQPDIPSQRNKITIIGDSMLKMLNPTLLRKSLKRSIRIKTFPGARFKDMEHYIKPTLESSPDYLIIHAGTNDLKYKSTKTITKEICTFGDQAATSLPNSTLVISQVITRSDDPNLAVKIKEVNKVYLNYAPKKTGM